MVRVKFQSLPVAVRAKLSRVKLLLLDVDGVLTDGGLFISDAGSETKRYSTRDGFALVWVKRYGLKTGVISGRRSSGTEARCRDLKMDEIHLGFLKKSEVFKEICARQDLKPDECAFIGDDLIDLPLIELCGVSAAPRDAHTELFPLVDVVLDFPGGNGAVRQMIDLWLMATGKWENSLEDILHGHF